MLFKYKNVDEIPYDVVSDELKEKIIYNYDLLTEDNLNELKVGMRVKYITDRTNTVTKTGIFVEIEDEIMKLTSLRKKRNMYVDIENSTIFFKYNHNNKLRDALEKLVKTNFKIVKVSKEIQQPELRFYKI
jgi:hypothetical protein|tara:strand:+ start:541 stop:933 length:393 start_codon:yes stop_codon:yes gene_type:complete